MMMIYMPSSVAAFCKAFEYLNFHIVLYRSLWANEIMPFLFWDNFFEWRPMDYKFIRAEFEMSPALYNLFDVMSIWLLAMLLIPIFWLLRKILMDYMIVANLEEGYRNNILNVMFNLTYMKIAMTSMVAIRYARWDTWDEIFSNALAGIGMCIVVFYPLFEGW
jgi:hypothetical protein